MQHNPNIHGIFNCLESEGVLHSSTRTISIFQIKKTHGSGHITKQLQDIIFYLALVQCRSIAYLALWNNSRC